MPSLTFVLPHWAYWLGLVAFPLAALYIVRRTVTDSRPRQVHLSLAYLLWLCGGFVGLHRLYLASLWGLAYIPLFVAILFSNIEERQARNQVSSAQNEVLAQGYLVERAQGQVGEGAEGAQERLQEAESRLDGAKRLLSEARADREGWHLLAAGFGVAIAVLMLIDAALLPRMTEARNEREAAPERAEREADDLFEMAEGRPGGNPAHRIQTPVTRVIDSISGWTGEFVAYWSLIAVFVYYYEVIARYVFNSPTNWAHESMFLMFGMQYLIAGAYALREDSHVRVDVIYAHLSARSKVIMDLITSIFFFVFTVAILVTGWIFTMDAVRVWEVSFTEWAIQYWPVKAAIPLGALLIVLQGLSHLIKNALWLRTES